MDLTKLKEIEGFDMKETNGFPFSGLKTIGWIHISIGVICGILGIINILTFVVLFDAKTFSDAKLHEYQELAFSLAISSTGIWCGIWYCMSGAMGVNISEKNKASVYCMKTSFLVLSILCAVIFGPACFCVNGYEAFVRHGLYTDDYKWLVPLLTAFFAFNEIVLSVVSAGVCCCCSSMKQSKVRVLLATEKSTFNMRPLSSTNEFKRPDNPHLQKTTNESFIPNGYPRNSNSSAMFKTNSRSKGRRNFTADHLNYNKDNLF